MQVTRSPALLLHPSAPRCPPMCGRCSATGALAPLQVAVLAALRACLHQPADIASASSRRHPSASMLESLQCPGCVDEAVRAEGGVCIRQRRFRRGRCSSEHKWAHAAGWSLHDVHVCCVLAGWCVCRSASSCVNLNNVTLVVPAQEELNYQVFMCECSRQAQGLACVQYQCACS